MQGYEGYFENGQFTPIGVSTSITGRRRVIMTLLDEPAGIETKTSKLPRSTALGLWKDKIWMSDDFNEPIDEMKEYME
jgi:hypothetical protein